MAASGIQEHNEGCRKQRVLERAAFARQMAMQAHRESLEAQADTHQSGAREDPEAPGYMRKLGSPPGIPNDPYGYQRNLQMQQQRSTVDLHGSHSPTAIDRLRRDGVRAQQLITYSAKIPDRLTSINFQQQW